MTRQEKIDEAAKEFLNTYIPIRYKKLCLKYNSEKVQIINDLGCTVSQLVGLARWQQDNLQKKAIKYFATSYLLSSVITGSYDFRLALFDDRYYLDQTETSVYWSPRWMFSYIDEDRAALEKAVRQKCVRLQEYELDEAWRAYVHTFYYGLAGFFFAENIKAAAMNSEISELHIEDQIIFLFDGIMDHPVQIDMWKRDNQNEIFSLTN